MCLRTCTQPGRKSDSCYSSLAEVRGQLSGIFTTYWSRPARSGFWVVSSSLADLQTPCHSSASASHLVAGMLELQMRATPSGFLLGFWGLNSGPPHSFRLVFSEAPALKCIWFFFPSKFLWFNFSMKKIKGRFQLGPWILVCDTRQRAGHILARRIVNAVPECPTAWFLFVWAAS